MVLDVPYLSEAQIEREADVLLGQFQATRDAPVVAPIPVDEILEGHLGLTLELGDLHAALGVPVVAGKRDLLGALWPDDRSVFVDFKLDPDELPSREGRYRFTVGHEIGHWQVQRQYLPSRANQPGLFEDESKPTTVCRRSHAKDRIEWQADFFAGCLLMPRPLVLAAWETRFGDTKSRKVQPEDEARALAACRDVARPFAAQFLVSVEAMRVRLEQLHLLQRVVPAQRALRSVL